MTHHSIHMGDPHKRFVVERRWVKPPPAPYRNEWELHASYDERCYADEAALDDKEDMPAWDYRVRDTETGNLLPYEVQRRLGRNSTWTVSGKFASLVEAQEHCDIWHDYSDGREKDYSLYTWRIMNTDTGVEEPVCVS